jgi:flagellar biosynthesis protein FlhG
VANVRDQAKVLRGLMAKLKKEQSATGDSFDPKTSEKKGRAHTIAITSGKGGVGKSNIALNLAIALSEAGKSVCLFDANLGLGNIDLLCGLNGYWNLSHVMTGARSLNEIILDGPRGIKVIPGASGFTDLIDCPVTAQKEILNQLIEIEKNNEYLIIDTSTGLYHHTRQILESSDRVMVISTPEPTSIADAYSTIKTIGFNQDINLEVILNQASSAQQASKILERIQQTAKVFLKTSSANSSYIPYDQNVSRAVIHRKPFMEYYANSPASKAIRQIASRIMNESKMFPNNSSFISQLWQKSKEKLSKAA